MMKQLTTSDGSVYLSIDDLIAFAVDTNNFAFAKALVIIKNGGKE